MSNKKVDYLVEDPDIPNQRFCCISFVEPQDTKVMTQKEVFMASRFLHQFVNEYETAKEFSSNPNNVVTDEIKKKLDLSFENVMSGYQDYRKSYFGQMSTEFDEKFNPSEALTVSGVKVRGSYRSYEEAQERANTMREHEPGINVYVAQVGYWLPYDPDNMEDVKANFREEQLNDIYGKRQEALEKAKVEFEQRKQTLVEKTNKENEEKKKMTTNEVMESMTEDKTHQEKKEDLVIVDVETGEQTTKTVPVKNEKTKKSKGKPQPAKKAGNRRVNKRRG